MPGTSERRPSTRVLQMRTIRRGRIGLSSAVLFGAVACALPSIASADPGELTAIGINTQGNNFGYLEYLPEHYDESQDWPVLIFLTGIGENGNGSAPASGVCTAAAINGSGVCRGLRHGPAMIANNNINWNDQQRPFIIISPQNPAPLWSYVPYNATAMDNFVDYIVDTYAVDESRIYLTGMSMGGYSVTLAADYNPDRYAAITFMPGINGVPTGNICNLTRQNIWAFHGQNDTNPFNPIGVASLVYNYENCPAPHPNARITIYTGAGHDVWTRTFNLTGMTSPVLSTFVAQGNTVVLDPYNMDIYSWLLMHDKPEVDAGPDVQGSVGTPISLVGAAYDRDAVTLNWTQVSGPAATLSNATSATATVTAATPGTYGFQLRLVDADNQWDTDVVNVTVLEGGGGDSAGDEAGEETSGGEEESESSGGLADEGESSGGAEDEGESSGGAGEESESSGGPAEEGGVEEGGAEEGGVEEGGDEGGDDPLDALDDDFASGNTSAWQIANPTAATASAASGQLVIEPNANTAWFQTLQSIQYYQLVSGNFSVVADVTVTGLAGGATTPNWRLGGLMMRDPSTSTMNTYHGAFGTVASWLSTSMTFEYQSTDENASTYGYALHPQGTGQVRICRVGSTVRSMFRLNPTDPWILGDQRQRADLGNTLAVGPVAFQFITGAPNLRASFDNVDFSTVSTLDDCAPGTTSEARGIEGLAVEASADPLVEELAPEEFYEEGCACSANGNGSYAGAPWMLALLGGLGLRRRRRAAATR